MRFNSIGLHRKIDELDNTRYNKQKNDHLKGVYIISEDDDWEELIRSIYGFLEKEDLSDERNDPYDINDPYDDHMTLIPLNKEIKESQLKNLNEVISEKPLSSEIVKKSDKTTLKIESMNNKGPCLKVYLAPYAHNLFPK